MENATQVNLQTVERPTTTQTEAPTEVEQARTTPPRDWTAALAVAIFGVALFLNLFRTMQAIDLTADESTYAIESVSLHRTGMTSWDGSPFFVHPPLFFTVEGLYYKALGVGNSPLFDRLVGASYHDGKALLPPGAPLTGDDMVHAVELGRYLNAFYGAILSVLVFLFGRSLMGLPLGLLGAALFTLDPYVVWRNHFNYLEPLFTLFGVASLYAYYIAQKKDRLARTRYLLLAGLFLGLAILTKELAILYFVAILAYALLFRRDRLVETLLPLGVGVALYAIFPIWTALSGHFDIWWDTKTWLFRRASGQLLDSGIGRPGVSLVDTLYTNLPDYWPWFLMLGVAFLLAVGFVYLYIRGARDLGAELLSASLLGMYGFFVVVRLVGGVVNEQYFYSLMPVVALSVGYAVLSAPRWISSLRSAGGAAPSARQGRAGWALLAVVGVPLAYNAVAWVVRYVFSTDNSYISVESRLAPTLPPGAGVVGRDILDMYLMPRQAVYAYSYLELASSEVEPGYVAQQKIPYAILNDQSLAQHYGGANEIYYDWVKANGKEIAAFQGRKYATALYQIDYSKPVQSFGAGSLSLGRPARASSVEDPATLGPQNAFDGNIATRWASRQTDNEWISVDLGSSKAMSRLELYWEQAYAAAYELQVSDDGAHWSTFYKTDEGKGKLETIEAKAKGRYVRLLLTRRATQYGYSLWEFAVYP